MREKRWVGIIIETDITLQEFNAVCEVLLKSRCWITLKLVEIQLNEDFLSLIEQYLMNQLIEFILRRCPLK